MTLSSRNVEGLLRKRERTFPEKMKKIYKKDEGLFLNSSATFSPKLKTSLKNGEQVLRGKMKFMKKHPVVLQRWRK